MNFIKFPKSELLSAVELAKIWGLSRYELIDRVRSFDRDSKDNRTGWELLPFFFIEYERVLEDGEIECLCLQGPRLNDDTGAYYGDDDSPYAPSAEEQAARILAMEFEALNKDYSRMYFLIAHAEEIQKLPENFKPSPPEIVAPCFHDDDDEFIPVVTALEVARKIGIDPAIFVKYLQKNKADWPLFNNHDKSWVAGSDNLFYATNNFVQAADILAHLSLSQRKLDAHLRDMVTQKEAGQPAESETPAVTGEPIATTEPSSTLMSTGSPASPQWKPRKPEVTQQEAAKRLGVTTRTIRGWEHGEHIPDGYPGRASRTNLLIFADSYKMNKGLFINNIYNK